MQCPCHPDTTIFVFTIEVFWKKQVKFTKI